MCDRRLVDSGYTREYPAASQYVTAVGGTALSRASNARGWTESVWSTNSTEGDLCTAGVGYDGPTGLGTPNGAAAFGPASTGSSDFSVSVNPTNVSVAAGSNATATVSTAVTSGSSDSVALSASGLPSRVTASFNPSTVNSGSSSTVTFAASSSAAAGNDSVTITGIGSHTATLTLSVTSGGGGGTCAAAQTITNPGFESGTAGGVDRRRDWTVRVVRPAHSFGHVGCLARRLRQGYVQHSFNVSGLAGQTVTLTLKGVEDSTLQTSFVIDDTALNVS